MFAETIAATLYLEQAEQHLSKRKNIGQTLEELRDNPMLLIGLLRQFNCLIDHFNAYQHPNSVIPNKEREDFMPNTLQLRRALGRGKYLPTTISLALDHSPKHQDNCQVTFQKANRLMERGEAGKNQDSWMFHRHITNPQVLVACEIVELFGLYTRITYPNLKNTNPVQALEEIAAVYYHDTALFESVKEYYTKPDGFSEKLVKYVNSLR